MKGLSWGLDVLDRELGRIQPGRIHVLGARPSCGKTSFALHWIDNHARTVERAFNTGEGFWNMPRRLAVFLTERNREVSRISWAAFRLGYDLDAATSEEWEDLPHGAEDRIAKELEWIDSVEQWVRFYDMTRPSLEVLTTAFNDQFEAYGAGPEIVLFDYIQKIKPRGRETRFDAIAEAAQYFQSLATEQGMAVLITSQLKRRSDGPFDKYRPPHLEDFKMAGDIEEVADVALGFFRPLGRMTVKEERDIKAGHMDLESFKINDTMAIKCLKHRWRGRVSDKIFWVRHTDGKIQDMHSTPPQYGTGDAWEPDDSTPF